MTSREGAKVVEEEPVVQAQEGWHQITLIATCLEVEAAIHAHLFPVVEVLPVRLAADPVQDEKTAVVVEAEVEMAKAGQWWADVLRRLQRSWMPR